MLVAVLISGAPAAGSAAAGGPGVAASDATGRFAFADPSPAPVVAAAVSYSAPLASGLQVVRGFDPPATRYGPGHLGVDLRTTPGAPVLAAGAGVVSFAGSVAGRGVVVVGHADGVSTEYEPVRPLVHAGARVARGQVLGALDGAHRGCAGSCLHWGARRAGAYFDPLTLLQRLGVVRLLPWHGPAP